MRVTIEESSLGFSDHHRESLAQGEEEDWKGAKSNLTSQSDPQLKVIFGAIQQLETGRLISFLKNMELSKVLELLDSFDENGYTLIHSACYYNSFKICDFLVKFFKERLTVHFKKSLDSEPADTFKERVISNVSEKLKTFVNVRQRGDEGFMALHFASYHGNPKMLKLLVQCGADIRAKNL